MFVFIPSVFDLAFHCVSTRFAVISSAVDLYTSEECCIVLHSVMRGVLLHTSGYSKQSSLVFIQGPATQRSSILFNQHAQHNHIYYAKKKKYQSVFTYRGQGSLSEQYS